MKRKKEIRLAILCGIVLCCLLVWAGYMRGDIGLSEKAMRSEVLEQVPEGEALHGFIGETMAVYLHYNEALTDIHTEIYVKRDDSIGWHFRYGGASGCLDYLQKLTLEENPEYALLYLSAEPISHVEIEKEDGSTAVINPEKGKPFVCVMDHRWNVTVYGMDGQPVGPVERSM